MSTSRFTKSTSRLTKSISRFTILTDSTVLDALQQTDGDLEKALDVLIPVDELSHCQSPTVVFDQNDEETDVSPQHLPLNCLVQSSQLEGSSGQHGLELTNVPAFSEPGPFNHSDNTDSDSSLAELLEQHSASVVIEEPVLQLEVSREKLWRQASGLL